MNTNMRFIILLLLLVNFLHAQNTVVLTTNEKEFLKNHPTILLGADESWAPYAIKNEDGTVSGYDVDILTRINKATGANFILQLGDWSKMQEMAKSKKIDGLSSLGIFEERKQWFNFSNIYISMKKMVMVKRGNPLKIKSIDDLSGKTIVITKGDMIDEEIAKKFKNSKIIYALTVKEMLEEVIFGNADATFGNGGTDYMLAQLGIPYLESGFPLKSNLDLSFAIRKDWPEAVSILNKGLTTISKFEQNKLVEKWFTAANNNSIKYNEDEYNYLRKKQEITMCIDPDWMPFEKLDQGKHIGMTADYFKIFQTQLGIPIKVIQTNSWVQSLEFAKNRKCDILSLTTKSADKEKYMNLTNPYIVEPIVLATKLNVGFISDLNQLKTEKIGIVKGYAFKEILLKQYPALQIVEVDNLADGLQKVVNGKLFGVIDTLPTIAYMFKERFLNELKISGKFIDHVEFSIAVRNDDLMLLNIFNKLIKNISLETKQNILNNYTAVHYEQGFDYSLFWKIFAVVAIIIILLIYRNRVIEKYNEEIQKHLHVIDSNFLTSSTDLEGNITHVSEALCNITGYTKNELIGKNHSIFRHPDMDSSTFKEMWETILKGNTWRGEVKNLNKDGSYYWADSKITPIFNKDGSIKGFDAMRHDITDRKRLKELSITDALTQIPNRLHLDECYANELERAKRYNSVFSVMIIDIDFFKHVNDEYGHKTGDDVLVQIANILKENIRNLDVLGRWGGEEFLIICPETNIQHAQILAEKIRKIIEIHDFKISKHITCSLGVTEFKHDDNAEDTFKRSDKALYEAKNSGRNKVVIEA